MDFNVCFQCGSEIEGKGIHYRNRVFCSDECCEEFEEEFIARGEPDLEELDEELAAGLGEDIEVDLGYQDDDEVVKDDLLDEDFEINPDDF